MEHFFGVRWFLTETIFGGRVGVHEQWLPAAVRERQRFLVTATKAKVFVVCGQMLMVVVLIDARKSLVVSGCERKKDWF